MAPVYNITFNKSDGTQDVVQMNIPDNAGTYKVAFNKSDGSVINAQGNIVVGNSVKTYNLKFNMSDGSTIDAGNFTAGLYTPYVFTVSGAPHNYAVCLSVTAGTVDATVTFADITKTVPAGTTATVSFTNSDTSVTEGQVEVRNSTAASCGTFSYKDDEGKSQTYNWNAIKSIISYDSTWTALPKNFVYKCTLTSLPNLSDNILSIETYAFYQTKGLCKNGTTVASFSFNNTLQRIEEFAFQGSDIGGIGLNVPNTLVSIGKSAFISCSNLTYFMIPDSVTSLGTSVFMNSAIGGVDLGEGLTVLPDSLFFASNISMILSWGSNIKELKYGVFSLCTYLEEIEIPASVEIIGDRVFNGCKNLSIVTLNNGLKTLGPNIFANCTSLSFITFKGTKAQWNAITKDEEWYGTTTLKQVNCTDGTITL